MDSLWLENKPIVSTVEQMVEQRRQPGRVERRLSRFPSQPDFNGRLQKAFRPSIQPIQAEFQAKRKHVVC